jgi:hypothetical protein
MENGNGSDGSGVANFGSLSLQDVALRGHFGFEGGALYNQGALEILDSLLEDNSADYGGGVENYGTLYVSGSKFVNNSAYEGGAIDNYEGTAEIHNSVFEGNSANSGGAISNYTTLAISDTTITDNAADFEGGGIYNAEGNVVLTAIQLRNNAAATDGGGLYSEDGSVLVQSSWIADNHGRSGGGIFTIDSSLTVDQSTITGNAASRDGGGISSDSSVSAVNAKLLVAASTIAGNTGTYGGGIDSVFTDTTIVNSTLSGNQARRDGGGIHNYGLLHVSHSTITANQADFDGDDNLPEGGGIFSGVGFQPRAVLANTIVAGNTKGLSSLPDDIGGLVDPLGSHNLIGDAATSGGLVDASAGNIVGNLGTGTRDIATILDVQLTDNGGPTWTHALVAGSSAIDAASSTLTLDQRGSARMLDGSGDGQATSDIGAYEFVSLTGLFAPIQQQIQSLGEDGTLSRGEQQRLLMFLGLAQRNFERTNLDTAIHFLELFRSHVEQMTVSASTDGLLSLRSAASQITEHLSAIRDEHRAVDELFADFVFSWD